MSAAAGNLAGMTYERILIDPFLTAFVARLRRAVDAPNRGRIDYLDGLLRRFLEETTTRVSCAHCQTLLDAERVLDPEGAFARTMDLEDLVFTLGGFIHSPWLRDDPKMRIVQWRFVEALLIDIQQTPMHDCEELDMRYADLWGHINWALRRSRARSNTYR